MDRWRHEWTDDSYSYCHINSKATDTFLPFLSIPLEVFL